MRVETAPASAVKVSAEGEETPVVSGGIIPLGRMWRSWMVLWWSRMKGAVGDTVTTGSMFFVAVAQRKNRTLLQEVEASVVVESAARLPSNALMAATQDMNKSSGLYEGQSMNAL